MRACRMESNPPPYTASSAASSQPPPGAAYYQPYPPPPAGGYSQPYPPYNYPPPGAASAAPPPPQTQQPKPATTTTIVINATGNCVNCRVSNHRCVYVSNDCIEADLNSRLRKWNDNEQNISNGQLQNYAVIATNSSLDDIVIMCHAIDYTANQLQ